MALTVTSVGDDDTIYWGEANIAVVGTDLGEVDALKPTVQNTGYGKNGLTSSLTAATTYTLSQAGQTIENTRFTGSVKVTAQNVTLRNCEIRGDYTLGPDQDAEKAAGTDQYGINQVRGATGLLVEYCEISHVYGKGINGTDEFTVRNCYIHECGADCIHVGAGDDWVVEYNLLERIGFISGSHADCVQCTGGSGFTIRYNTCDARFYPSPLKGGVGILIQDSSGRPIGTGIVVDNNWGNGGNFTYQFGRKKPDGVYKHPSWGPIASFSNNHYGPGPNTQYEPADGPDAHPLRGINGACRYNHLSKGGGTSITLETGNGQTTGQVSGVATIDDGVNTVTQSSYTVQSEVAATLSSLTRGLLPTSAAGRTLTFTASTGESADATRTIIIEPGFGWSDVRIMTADTTSTTSVLSQLPPGVSSVADGDVIEYDNLGTNVAVAANGVATAITYPQVFDVRIWQPATGVSATSTFTLTDGVQGEPDIEGQNLRRSAIAGGLLWMVVSPVPDGGLDRRDTIHLSALWGKEGFWPDVTTYSSMERYGHLYLNLMRNN